MVSTAIVIALLASGGRSPPTQRRCACVITGSTIFCFCFVLTAWTPEWGSYIRLPGVAVTLLNACITSVSFFRCPRRPLFGKVLTLALLVPSLWFAVYCVMGLIYRRLPF